MKKKAAAKKKPVRKAAKKTAARKLAVKKPVVKKTARAAASGRAAGRTAKKKTAVRRAPAKGLLRKGRTPAPPGLPKIVPHLWFDRQAKEAAEFYTSVFPESRIKRLSVVRDTPSGDCDIVTFNLCGQEFQAISAGPHFKFNTAISFIVNFDPARDASAVQRIDAVWSALSQGGRVLMPLGSYPFSKRYGWVEDRFGLSWQLILSNPDGAERPWIIPSLLFAGDSAGKAEAARKFYLSAFKPSKGGTILKYGAGQAPEAPGSVMFTDFELLDLWFAAMDSAQAEPVKFNEAVSFQVFCENQKEIDSYWKKLSAVPEAEMCGWLKDRFGVSWQIVPRILGGLLEGDPAKAKRVTAAFLKMKKFNIAELERAASL